MKMPLELVLSQTTGAAFSASNPAAQARNLQENPTLNGGSLSSENNRVYQVELQSTIPPVTASKSFWEPLRRATEAMSFRNYKEFIDTICEASIVKTSLETLNEKNATYNVENGHHHNLYKEDTLRGLARSRFLPFNDTDSYRIIKVLTEFFLLTNCTIDPCQEELKGYAVEFNTRGLEGIENLGCIKTIPYLNIIRDKLSDLPIKPKDIGDMLKIFTEVDMTDKIGKKTTCYGILLNKLTQPCAIELIWSYWHEEAMLVQAMSAISLRFQNRRMPGRSKDPLANMAIAPLLPMNNLLWGYVQDEQHRLSVMRRAYEYDHHYGITLQGKAVPNVEGADSRSNFLSVFHNLLHRCIAFFQQVDDNTVTADGFPLLNGLRDVHLTLSEGAHNQYGDLPWNARVEMLMQQWMLSRPEFREFLPSRTMVAYPEAWMGPLSTMNSLQGWTNMSPINFNTLAVFGERLLLSIRLVEWPELTREDAANWAIEYRNEIQGYIHAYNTVTGVDLTTPNPQTGMIDAQQPAVHLLRRARASSNGNGQAKNGVLAR
ncbi:MAG TPA: hypothetical protein PKC76_12010 [Saprospiraceae bacterium]|nr:hypothetical protein [Saprospiraceae bacterium]HMP24853.1 hypothetical protein [Saprospiraceae bacterium]